MKALLLKKIYLIPSSYDKQGFNLTKIHEKLKQKHQWKIIKLANSGYSAAILMYYEKKGGIYHQTIIDILINIKRETVKYNRD